MKKISVTIYRGNEQFESWHIESTLIPVNSAVLIANTESPEAEEKKLEIKDALLRQFLWLLPDSGHKEIADFEPVLSRTDKIIEVSNQTPNKILIIVGDGQNETIDLNNVNLDGFKVLPVFKDGTNFKLDSKFSRYNAEWWGEKITEILPRALGLLKLAPDELKIFISYKRTDTEGIARQLYHALQEKGAEVFLDSFTFPSGVNFQRRLAQQLADKAMVVILESPNLTASPWVMRELNFAKVYRLGYCALHFEEKKKHNLPQIDDDNRYPFEHANYDHGDEGMVKWTLNAETLPKVVNFIKLRHAVALMNKHNYLKRSLEALLLKKNYTFNVDENGYIDVTGSRSCHKIGLNIRPSEAKDFYKLDNTHCDKKSSRVIVGPMFHLQERKRVNSWLAGKSGVAFFDEGNLVQLVNNL